LSIQNKPSFNNDSSKISFCALLPFFLVLSCKMTSTQPSSSDLESTTPTEYTYFKNYDALPDIVCFKNEIEGNERNATITDAELGEWIGAFEVGGCDPEISGLASELTDKSDISADTSQSDEDSVSLGLVNPEPIGKLIRAIAKVSKHLTPTSHDAPRFLAVMGKHNLRVAYLKVQPSRVRQGRELSSTNILAALPSAEHFTKSLDQGRRTALLQKIARSTDFREVAGGALSGREGAYQQWILRAVSPLVMGKEELMAGDIFQYGDEAFETFSHTVTSAYASPARGGLVPMPRGSHLVDAIRDETKYPVLATLRTINKELVHNRNGEFRGSGHEVMHSIPLTPQEILAANDLAKDGYLSVHEIKTPFKNAYGKMVTGQFIYYPPGNQVSNMLKKMNVQFSAELAAATKENDKITAIARMVRRCITIHPFGDGNGRSCSVLGVWALARQGIPHSLQWAGEDILLGEKLWIERYRQGIEAHRQLLKTL